VTETLPTGAPDKGERGARHHAHPALVLLIIAGAQLMVVLDGTIVNIALPSMGHYFDKNQTDMTWALNAYSLAFGGLLLLGGRAGDILGRRRMFIVGLGLFTTGSFMAGLAVNFPMLLTGRVVQGLGGAIASPTALSLITTEFEEGRERTRAIAVYAAVSGAGAALGLLLGGVLTNYFSWRWVLFVNIPIGIALITGAFLYLHQSERLNGRFDVIGGLLSVAGMSSLVYGFIHVAHSGWSNAETSIVFTATVVLLVGFVLFEAFVSSDPMMPMRIFEERNRGGTYLVMLVVGAGMFGMFYFVTFFVQGVRDYSALKTGIAFLPIALVIGVTAQIVAKLLPKFGPKPIITTGTVILTIAMLWLSRVSIHSSYAGTLLPGMLILALAMGLLFVPLTVTAVAKIANTDAGLASALLNVGQQVGGAIGLSVLATVFQTSANNYSTVHRSDLVGPALHDMGPALGGQVLQHLQAAGSNGLQPEDIGKYVNSFKDPQQHELVARFFGGLQHNFINGGPYHEFARAIQAHASGQGFFGAAMFGVVAVLVAVFVIQIKKTDLPSKPPMEVIAA
jgi:EmrB/QacA subfamily drug resistance transporter